MSALSIPLLIDVEPLPQNRLLAFHSVIGTAEQDGRAFEITRSEVGGPALGFYEKRGQTHTVDLTPLMHAVLSAILRGDAQPDEPSHGSIVLLHGRTGTAYQRYFRDGLWHADGHEPKTWADLVGPGQRVQVVYVAPEGE